MADYRWTDENGTLHWHHECHFTKLGFLHDWYRQYFERGYALPPKVFRMFQPMNWALVLNASVGD